MRTTDSPPATAADLAPYLRVHRLLRRSAAELAVAAARAPADARTDRALARWFHGFAGEIRCHHHIEDVLLFPALRTRVATYHDLAPQLTADHADLDEVLDSLTAALDARDRQTARLLAAQLRDHLDEHLAFEDDEVAPLFARHFTFIEFEELNDRAVKMTSLKQLVFTAPWMMSLLDDSERAELLSTVPKAMGVLWRLTRRRYARMAVSAFVGVAS
jgi:hemerythrin-like domain-containing protein